ncbi:tRNA threonylcarbamoyladenosine modification (KEOPS) complex Cgi121 subunit [Methanomicrobium sp. W14]|uniref:KEOPS complex subunit Cgi121 n=1 Tax=Methanomicrobium sp. W14 TaxID=2817839 RepID=UPI001AE88808|nr:KEOPS complex subunit Cgi121 [Methanomicrobium sp. W14]MBP2133260.1 tRNA threonylcarbamoyladenosine modification (KEOPS) complex Cgi121 subunit [Methanomicrobium sp. W14]
MTEKNKKRTEKEKEEIKEKSQGNNTECCEFFSVEIPKDSNFEEPEKTDSKDKACYRASILFCGIKAASAEIADVKNYLKELKKTEDKNNVHIICLDERYIAGIRHIKSAVFHAKRAWSRGEQISKSFEMEVLLYAAGTRQCSEAGSLGFKRGRNRLYICVAVDSSERINDSKTAGTIISKVFNELSGLFSFDNSCKDPKNPYSLYAYDFFLEKLQNLHSFPDEDLNKTKKDASKGLGSEKSDEKFDEIFKKKTAALMKMFEISDDEIKIAGYSRLPELVAERVALLDVTK